MMIDIEPLIPLLDAAKKAKAELAASNAEWEALGPREQQAQVDAFLDRDDVANKAYDAAALQLIEALHSVVINYGN